MATFEEFRLLLVLYYDANCISDEDFLRLYEMFPSKNPHFPYNEYSSFDLDNMSEDEYKAELRFIKNDLPDHAEALQIPPLHVLYALMPKTYFDNLDFTDDKCNLE